jgi:hypothetical protein
VEAGTSQTQAIEREVRKPSPESAEAHGRGWDQYMARLAIAVAGGDPGEDPNHNPEEM